ncbi:uncharacterized protein LTR77_005998 [Saxophila tyrrhenica]|uniref:Uncharacterized protein n=1 Tax=Saxophila tyrrhenica TaxID=1690608 RepID=A0AAV9P6M4_9PEZI|nr:hypothetical protein LTR77_005998 [Saxophila tyrrhenica]
MELTSLPQAQRARRCLFSFVLSTSIDLLLASPLRRALQTCTLTFAPALSRGHHIIALPYAEEASDAPCDTGSEPALLRSEFPNISFDHVGAGWWVHEGEYAFEPAALIARAAKLRRWIKARPEKEVVLVAHGFFNHYLTGDVDEKGEQSTPWWDEAELRTYTFEEEGAAFDGGGAEVDGQDGAAIRETEESLKRLGSKKGAGEVRNVNRPGERRNSLSNYGQDGPLVLN